MATKKEKLKLFRSFFVGREDAYAKATFDKPAYVCVKKKITNALLVQHLNGEIAIGSYVTLPEKSLSKAIILDIDKKEKHYVDRLVAQASPYIPGEAIVIEDTGGRGWHVWLLFDRWVAAGRLKRFGEQLVQDAAPGIDIEVFPKSGKVEKGGFGTLVRLPLGRHPRTKGRGKLYTPAFEPLELEDIKPTSPDRIPPLAEGPAEPTRTEFRPKGYPCIQKIEQGVPEGHRDEAMFALACHYRQRGSSQDIVRAVLEQANAKNNPPLGKRVLGQKVKSAFKGKTVVGCSTPVLKLFCVKSCPYRKKKVLVRRSWRAGDLLKADIPPLHWIIQDMLPQGFAILAGKPKLGKSFMVLQMAQAVGRGDKFLGHSCNPGPVLLFALEDGERRVKERLAHLEIREDSPLQIELELPRFGEGGYRQLRDILDEGYDGTAFQLIIIDSLSRAKSTKKEEISPEDMEAIVRPLQSLGHEMACAFILVHHHRKGATVKQADVIWDPRGSGAIVGVADVAIGIYRDKEIYKFLTRSRDAPELSYILSFNEAKWALEGSEMDIGRTQVERGIIAFIKAAGPVTPNQIALFRGVSLQVARRQLSDMADRGKLIKDTKIIPHVYGLSEQADDHDQLGFGV